MRFSDDYLREIAERNPIEEVVGEYVALTKRSGINIFGLCPFHGEKTPSFSVCPSRGIYHCFGCGKGGSVINFIMEIEHLDFPEAVEFLAKRAGMPLPERGDDPRAGAQVPALRPQPRRGALVLLPARDARRGGRGGLHGPEADFPPHGQKLRPRLRAGQLGRAHERHEGPRLLRARAHGGRAREARQARRRVRRLQEPAHVPRHRPARERHSLLGAHTRRRRAQVPEQPRDARLQQEPEPLRY